MVVIRLAAFALADELRHRAPGSGGPVTREIPMAGGRLQAFASLHRALVDASDLQAPRAQRGAIAQLEARMVGWLADCLAATSSASSPRAVAAQRVRLVEEWVDAHLAAPITLGRLCAVAGVGDRWLESAFRAHRGQTPLEFVIGRRLAWVRRRLLDATPGTSITQLAHDAGFVHLGRFAARYRQAYGESPSQTLHCRLRRA
jgi:transcriptional regulator GlxA family with amidase domain